MDDETEIREAVKIITERLRTNPEDFRVTGKLEWVVSHMRQGTFKEFCTPAEVEALHKAWADNEYGNFHNRVMKSLLGDREYVDPTHRKLRDVV